MMIHDVLNMISVFEERNNISVMLELHSDESGTIREFWDDDSLEEFISIPDLIYLLENTNYKKDEDGLCIHPVERI